MPTRDMTLLWALRSPCNLGCRYCYFGTLDEHRIAPPTGPGQLSHLSRDDLTRDQILAFLATIGDSAVARVFLAGGEPLIWPPVFDVIARLKAGGVQVVVCTNGIPLTRPEVAQQLTDLRVDAVSVSLDSADPGHNDRFRPTRSGDATWRSVNDGIRSLLVARGSRATPRIGLYTVVTRHNIDAVVATGRFAAGLGLDYYVPQPIALAHDHPLYDELSLRDQDTSDLQQALTELYAADLPIGLPDATYPVRFVDVTGTEELRVVPSCFGGHTLAFIEPDGSVWDCPSSHRIAATPPERRRTIAGRAAADLFSPTRTTCAADCSLGSRDCVNMWPLMDFDGFLTAPSEAP
jgi:MoaA/NifB/PqqE/SkfB family radical SAM enzyme